MRHLWTCVLLMTTANVHADYLNLYGRYASNVGAPYIEAPTAQNYVIMSGGPFTNPNQKKEPFGSAIVLNSGGYKVPHFGNGRDQLISGSNSGGPFRVAGNDELIITGNHNRGLYRNPGVVNGADDVTYFAQGRDQLISGSNSGGPFRVTPKEEGIITENHNGGPFSSAVNGGDNVGHIDQGRDELLVGNGSGGPFRDHTNLDGSIYGNQNRDKLITGNQSGGPFASVSNGQVSKLIVGDASGGPFRIPANMHGIITGNQSGGPFAEKPNLVDGSGVGGPFGQGKTELIQGSNRGGPFRVTVEQEEIGTGGQNRNYDTALINGGSRGGPFAHNGERLSRNSEGRVISGSQMGGPFADLSGNRLINGGNSGGPFAQRTDELINGSSRGGPFRKDGN